MKRTLMTSWWGTNEFWIWIHWSFFLCSIFSTSRISSSFREKKKFVWTTSRYFNIMNSFFEWSGDSVCFFSVEIWNIVQYEICGISHHHRIARKSRFCLSSNFLANSIFHCGCWFIIDFFNINGTICHRTSQQTTEFA